MYTVSDMKVIHIARDDVFINDMVAKLLTFYTSSFRAAVLDSQLLKPKVLMLYYGLDRSVLEIFSLQHPHRLYYYSMHI